ncbi:protein of unknown function DUF650 [Pyrolobus fumarii 1A]|uniref:DNA repair protein n=1 Tax=Pyrolobus fumarii (strain DSM 11204 / 1A) TaxID=694429 RepID=G0EGR5_PYRF1|nr:Nre family DNA repair protein [Pyrolobus fumarii]AEM39213.1 protein of unknown function DUF650 [Pyrolobus fumarii 1A]
MPGGKVPAALCARCKGYKRLCGLPQCPILARFRAQVFAVAKITSGDVVEGDTPPSLVVGEEGYPRVPVLYQVPPGEQGDSAKWHDDPVDWAGKRVKLDVILELRSRLVGGVERLDVRQPWVLYEKEIGLAAVSETPVSSEVLLARRPVPRLVFDGMTAPQGPAAPAREIRVTGNPKPPRKIEKLVFDDAPAADGVWEAYRAGVDYYALIRAFSAGFIGRLRSRRLVPTRWAITAVDSIIGSRLRSLIATGNELGQVELYKAYYLGNRFIVILAPGPLRVEMIEVWHPSTPWVRSGGPVAIRVWERPSGQPSEMDGGFMAARLAILEALAARRRKGYALVIREILPEYYAPVGNWHIRETLRRALQGKPQATFSSINEALSEALRMVDAKKAVEAKLRLVRRGAAAQQTLDKWLKG